MAREQNPFRFTKIPTMSPTTTNPTESPTLFTEREDYYPVNKPPLNPPADYFDYSVGPSTDSVLHYMKTFTNARGPDAWGSLGDSSSTREGRYWSEMPRAWILGLDSLCLKLLQNCRIITHHRKCQDRHEYVDKDVRQRVLLRRLGSGVRHGGEMSGKAQ